MKWLAPILVIAAAAALTPASTQSATVTYTYDALGRVSTVIYPDGTQVVYTYDAAGNRTQKVVTP